MDFSPEELCQHSGCGSTHAVDDGQSKRMFTRYLAILQRVFRRGRRSLSAVETIFKLRNVSRMSFARVYSLSPVSLLFIFYLRLSKSLVTNAAKAKALKEIGISGRARPLLDQLASRCETTNKSAHNIIFHVIGFVITVCGRKLVFLLLCHSSKKSIRDAGLLFSRANTHTP